MKKSVLVEIKSKSDVLREKNKKKNNNSKNTVILVVILIFFFVIILPFGLGIIYAFTQRKKIRANWPEYRCKPYVLPIASQVGPPGINASKNFSHCMSEMIKNVVHSITSPITNSIGKIIHIVKHLSQSIQDIRKFFYRMREDIIREFKDIQQKIFNTFRRLAYVFRVFQRLLFQVFVTFKSVFMMGKYALYSIASLWAGPLGGIIRFFCFGGETLIETKNGVKPIRDVEIGDILKDNAKVLGKLELKKSEDMYLYKNISVSGSHMVYENNKWIKIKESKLSQKINYPFDNIYCLITDTGEIKIDNIIFKDFNCTDGFENYLNIVKTIPLNNKHEIEKIKKYGKNIVDNFPLINEKGRILTNGGIKLVKDLKIGDSINYQRIVGIVDYKIEGDIEYSSFEDGINKLKLYGNQFIRKNSFDKWCVLSHSSSKNKTVKCRGLIMENGYIDLGKIQLLDLELYDTDILGKIQENLI